MTAETTIELISVEDEAGVSRFLERRKALIDPFVQDERATFIGRALAHGGRMVVTPGMWAPGYVLLSRNCVVAMKANVVTDLSKDRRPSLTFRRHGPDHRVRGELARRGGTVVLALHEDDSKLFELSFLVRGGAAGTTEESSPEEDASTAVEDALVQWAAESDIPLEGLGTLPTAGEAFAGRAKEVIASTSDKVTLSEFREVTSETLGKIVEVLAVHEAEISHLRHENERLAEKLALLTGEDPRR